MRKSFFNLMLALSVIISTACMFAACGKTEELPQPPQVGNMWSQVAANAFEIPDLNEGFIPQGLCYDEEQDAFLLSGYMADGSDSRIYVVDAAQNRHRYFTLSVDGGTVDGGVLSRGHFGGIATAGAWGYIATNGCVLRFSLETAHGAKNGGSVPTQAVVQTSTCADFCCADENGLWVGEYYYPYLFETDPTHHVTVSATETNYALAVFYPFDNASETGLAATPMRALSLPKLVQGMAVLNDGRVLLSMSNIYAESKINLYSDYKLLEQNEIVVDGATLPLQVLSSGNLQTTITAPPMSEGIVCRDGKLFVLFESAATKYSFLGGDKIDHVQSANLAELQAIASAK